MHCARFAPELSATVTIVLSWITVSTSGALLRALDELDEPPALVLRHRPRLHEADRVADLALVRLVVNLELRAAADVAAVRGMLHQALDGDDDRRAHPVAHRLAHPKLSAIAYRRHSVLRDAAPDGRVPAANSEPFPSRAEP